MYMFKVYKAKEGRCEICRDTKADINIKYGTKYGDNSCAEVHGYCKKCAAMIQSSIENLFTWNQETEKEWE